MAKIPNFPTPPQRDFTSFSMPNDLVANGRNYYTEIFFVDYRTAAYGGGNFLNSIFTGSSSATVGAQFGGAVRLPIPRAINDITTLNWTPIPGLSIIGSAVSIKTGAGLTQAAAQAANAIGGLVGKAVNPLLFMTFNHQNFKEYTFEWTLAPKNRQESQTIKDIITTFKNASLPTKGFIMDYPLVALVNISPNNLNGHAQFKPMAIQFVAANYTPNPGSPSFFGNSGAPTMVTLTVNFKEIKLWYRGEVV